MPFWAQPDQGRVGPATRPAAACGKLGISGQAAVGILFLVCISGPAAAWHFIPFLAIVCLGFILYVLEISG